MGFCKESAGEIKKAGVSTIKLHTGKVIFDRALENTNINLKTTVMKLKKRIRELESENSRLEKKIEELTKELNKQKK